MLKTILLYQMKRTSSRNEVKSANNTQTAFNLVFFSLNTKIQILLKKTQTQKYPNENKESIFLNNNQKSVALPRFLLNLKKVTKRSKNNNQIEKCSSYQTSNTKRVIHLMIPILILNRKAKINQRRLQESRAKMTNNNQ